MMIDDDTLKQLLRINDELMQLCKFLNEKRDVETSSRLIPLVGRPYPHSDSSRNPKWEERKMDQFGGIFWLAIFVFGVVLTIAWIVLPFALIGTKPLLRELITEQRKTNALLTQRNAV